MRDDSSNANGQDPLPTLLTPADVYQYLGGKIGKGAIYELIRSGRMQSIRVGQRSYVTATEVSDWLTREAKAA